jgi:hypothetical protein
MPSNFKSPYASSFTSAIKRGTPCSVVVNSIANRTKKTPSVIFNSLFKAGLVDRQKFNGQWVYWPVNGKKTNATTTKNCQHNMWQWFVDWCIAGGWCTPKQFSKHTGSQAEFMSFCKKFFGKQFTGVSGTTTKKSRKTRKPKSKARKSTTIKSRKPKTTPRKSRSTSTYKFPSVKSRTMRRYRKAA